MQPDILSLEPEALGSLSPALRGLATTVNRTTLTSTSADPASDTPTMVTARSVGAETLSAVQTAVAEHLHAMADWIDRAHAAFSDADRPPASTGSNDSPSGPATVLV